MNYIHIVEEVTRIALDLISRSFFLIEEFPMN